MSLFTDRISNKKLTSYNWIFTSVEEGNSVVTLVFVSVHITIYIDLEKTVSSHSRQMAREDTLVFAGDIFGELLKYVRQTLSPLFTVF